MPSESVRASIHRPIRSAKKARKGDKGPRSEPIPGPSSALKEAAVTSNPQGEEREWVKTHTRHSSSQSLKLDLNGLDLGGNPGPTGAPSGPTNEAIFRSSLEAGISSPFEAHLRSHSGGLFATSSASSTSFNAASVATARSPSMPASPFMHQSSSEEAFAKVALSSQAEDSFAVHLRSECAAFNEIMPSHAVLCAEEGCRPLRSRRSEQPGSAAASGEAEQAPKGHSRLRQQVLGGFASLGLSEQTPDAGREGSVSANGLRQRRDKRQLSLQPVDSSDSSGAKPDASAASPDSSRLVQAGLLPAHYAYLEARPSDPLKTLDFLSIDEMGLHAVDVGNLGDWEGQTLTTEFICALTMELKRVQWSIATSSKRQKKWIVVPESFCPTMQLACDDQGYRSVVACHKPHYEEAVTGNASATAKGDKNNAGGNSSSSSGNSQASPSSANDLAIRSAFSMHRGGYELSFLRKPPGTHSSSILLARPEVHRALFRQQCAKFGSRSTDVSSSCPNSPSTISTASEPRVLPFYPVLRRSRSRTYIRDHTQTIRRSRSRPCLKTSEQAALYHDAADRFAPSLPGDPGARYHPIESWPSARQMSASASVSSDGASSRTSSDSRNSTPSSVGPVTTSYSQASTCGMSEAPVSDSVWSKTAVPSSASPFSLAASSSPGFQESYFPGRISSPFNGPLPSLAAPTLPPSLAASDLSPSVALASGSVAASVAPSSHLAPTCSESARRSMQVSEGSRSQAGDLLASTPDDLHLARVRTLDPFPSHERSEEGMLNEVSPQQAARRAVASVTGQRKDRGLGGWFKKKVGSISPSSGRAHSPTTRFAADPSRADASSQAQTAASAHRSPRRSMALTRKALEQIEALVERPASPESTVMGSRRGSEGIAIKVTGSKYLEAEQDQDLELVSRATDQTCVAMPAREIDWESAPGRVSMMDSRSSVNASLARIYGWSDGVSPPSPSAPRSPLMTRMDTPDTPVGPQQQQQYTEQCGSKRDEAWAGAAYVPPLLKSHSPLVVKQRASEPTPRSRNTDDENALLGLDHVSADALTMLIPLPLIGRPRRMPASRYLRITFTPFGDPTPTSECSSAAGSGSAPAEREAAMDPATARPAASSGLASARLQYKQIGGHPANSATATSSNSSSSSSWYRRLGFNSSSRSTMSFSSAASRKESTAAAAGVTNNKRDALGPAACSQTQWATATSSNVESFRISGQVMDAPDVDQGRSVIDPRLPPTGSFPVVLGFCEGRRGVELVQEGWEAVGLVGGCEDRTVLSDDNCHPAAGVSDVIVAACAAIADY